MPKTIMLVTIFSWDPGTETQRGYTSSNDGTLVGKGDGDCLIEKLVDRAFVDHLPIKVSCLRLPWRSVRSRSAHNRQIGQSVL